MPEQCDHEEGWCSDFVWYSVCTVCLPTETSQECADRHARSVAQGKDAHPENC